MTTVREIPDLDELLDLIAPGYMGLMAYWWYWAYFSGRYFARRLS